MTQAFTKSTGSDIGNTVQKIIQQHPLGRQKRSSTVLLFSEEVTCRICMWKLDHSSS